ncbi:MAG: hypothetical protein IPN29_04145 [Saprospiraceae bacterium]|nr:hypothetical protein [Saprospiraceae bacterium]
MSKNSFLKKYSIKIKALNPGDSTAIDDWNILEKRMNHLDRKRKRRYVFFFILFGLVFILGGSYLYERFSSTLKNNDTSIPIAEKIQNKKNKTFNSAPDFGDHLPSNVEMTENVQPGIFTKIKEAGVDAPMKDVKYTLKRNKNKKQHNINHTQLPHDNKVFAEKDKNTLQDNNDLKEKSSFDNSTDIENIKLFDNNDMANQAQDENDISKLNFSLISVDALKSQELKIIKRKNEVNVVLQPLISVHKYRMKYFVKIDGGPIYNLNTKSTFMSGPLVFTSHEESKNMGFQNSIHFQLTPNNKWKFNAGITRSQFMCQRSHIASLRLMDGICLNPDSNDPKEYFFSYVVANGKSTSEVNLRLSEENPGSPFDSTDVFKIEMGMHKKTVSWSIPITIERELFSTGDWAVFAKGGLNFGFASYSNETITHFSESCANLCFIHGFSPVVSSQKSNQLNTGMILGTSLEWHLSPKIRLVFNPEINTGINMSKGDHNNSNKWGINLGASYQIK